MALHNSGSAARGYVTASFRSLHVHSHTEWEPEADNDQICENTTRSSVFSFYSLKIIKTHEERKSCCIFMNFTIYILHTLDRGTSLRFRSSDFLYTLSSFDLLIVHPSFILGSGDDLQRVQQALFRFLGSPRT